jgi:hypothetical protein
VLQKATDGGGGEGGGVEQFLEKVPHGVWALSKLVPLRSDCQFFS